ncbi:MAG: hypothetical protein ACU843_18825 [Gammaproteobacteria bacterium]
MNRSEVQDYWRWKMVRQLSDFINDPGEQNTGALLQLIEAYPKISRSLAVPGTRLRIEPPAADFVCTMDL